MKIILSVAAISLAVGVGATYLLARAKKRTAHKSPITFRELYEDNRYSDCGLFD